MAVSVYQLTPESRKRLLRVFPARYPFVVASHVTHALGHEPAPEARRIEVLGHAYDDEKGIQAVAVAVDGRTHQPGRRHRYHITISLDPSLGAKPHDAANLFDRGFSKVGRPRVRLKAHPSMLGESMWQMNEARYYSHGKVAPAVRRTAEKRRAAAGPVIEYDVPCPECGLKGPTYDGKVRGHGPGLSQFPGEALCPGSFQLSMERIGDRSKSTAEALIDEALQFTAPFALRHSKRHVPVVLDVQKVDQSWQHDRGFHIGPGGTGNPIGTRYHRFGEFLKQGVPIEGPEICGDTPTGQIRFSNGRHRFAYLRDQGVRSMPFWVDKREAPALKRRFGVTDVTEAHDYDPSWDYELDAAPHPDVQTHVGAFLNAHAKQGVFSALGVPRPTVHYVRGLTRGHMARYVDGTSSDPVIVLDSHGLHKAAARHGVHLRDAVESTLLHEYGHAYCDSTGNRPPHEEDAVERFAFNTWKNGTHKRAARDLKREINECLDVVEAMLRGGLSAHDAVMQLL